MVGKNKIGWKKLVAVPLLAAVFVASNFFSLIPQIPQQQVSAESTGANCPNAGDTQGCTILTVTVRAGSIPLPADVFVQAVRSSSIGTDDTFNMNSAGLNNTTEKNFSSVRLVSGTNASGGTGCDPSSNLYNTAAGTFVITARSTNNTIIGTTTINACRDQRNTNNVVNASITLNNDKGGLDITAQIKVTSDGQPQNCESTVINTYVDPANQTQYKIGPEAKLKTGLDLTPDTYTVNGVCVLGGQSYNTSQNNVVVTAGKLTPVNLVTSLQGEPVDETNPSADAATDPNLDCQVDGNPLNWILCPIIHTMNVALNGLDNLINNLLTVDQKAIFDTNTQSGAAYHGAWQTFRGFALAILLIGGLFMIIAQSLGFEVLSAYTIKKILPRLIFAVIGIALSWEIMKFFVVFTNDLGNSIRSIIYYPFRGFEQSVSLSGGGTLLLDILGLGAIAALGLGGLFSFVVTAALAILVAVLVLIVRQLVIIMLVLFAPLAIACFILPNTQSLYKLWYESFTKAMMMFPIIVAFLALGRVFAVATIGSSPNPISQIIAFFSYIMPYFLIPLTFKFAGGALRTVGGSINDKNRGLFDRQKKYRANKIAERGQKAKAGELFNNKTLNGLTSRATTRNLGLGRRGREAFDNKMMLSAGAFAKSENGMGVQFKDDVLQAMTYGSAGEAKNRLKQDFGMSDDAIAQSIAGVKAAGGFGKARQTYAAKQLAATGTGYDSESQMFATIARVSGGNKSQANSMWGEMRGTAEKAGRNDLKAGYGLGSNILSDIIDNGDAKASAGAIDRKYQEQFEVFGVDAMRGVDPMSRARNKGKSIQNMMKRAGQSTERNTARASDLSYSADERRYSEVTLGQITSSMENFKNNTQYGAEINAEAVAGSRVATSGSGRSGRPAALTEARRPGYIDVAPAAATAASRSEAAQAAYVEEYVDRQRQYDPNSDPRNN